MAPVLCNADQPTNNSTIERERDNEEYDSEDDRFREEFIDETACEPLDNNHHLYGYVPDEGYNPHSMEEDGTYPEEFTWTYEDPPEDGLNEDLYHYCGSGLCLRHQFSTRFCTVLEACGVAGGFTYELIKRITANSNAYASKNIQGSNFAGSFWHPKLG